MAYHLPSERLTLTVDDGLAVEVERVASWAIVQTAARLAASFASAKGAAELGALRDLYEFFVAEAQPTWDLMDHRGPIQPTAGGMLRLPIALGLALVEGWAGTLEPTPTAVDEVVPPGPVRDALNAELRKSRRKKV